MNTEHSPSVRLPSVAGQFYPDDPVKLHQQITAFLENAQPVEGACPKAIVAPHAGYIYSGPVAASAYKKVMEKAGAISRVVIMSPAHRYGFQGIAWSAADYFRTPLGDIKVDRDAIASLADLDYVKNIERAFDGEHALEVHLPFLQSIIDDFQIVPFIVGMAEPRQVAEVLNRLWGGQETLIVISSDLSHFNEYQNARQRDSRTTAAIETLRFEDIGGDDACGVYPLSGLLLAARERNLQAEAIDLRNSGDTAGSRESVVGYGAYLIH